MYVNAQFFHFSIFIIYFPLDLNKLNQNSQQKEIPTR